MQVSVSGEVNLFRLSREAYQKAAAMYPHEADKVVKILADRLREEAEKNAKQSYFSPSASSARDIQSCCVLDSSCLLKSGVDQHRSDFCVDVQGTWGGAAVCAWERIRTWPAICTGRSQCTHRRQPGGCWDQDSS